MNTIGGVAYLREQFYESVSKYMGSTTTLDKKTVRGDVDLMVESEKLGARTEPVSGRKIIFFAHCWRGRYPKVHPERKR